jgi:AcrR family transcriptional regulator
VIEAAAAFMRANPMTAFSLESVAAAAGVTRLTVYKQFGSRGGLLEAVFDRLARAGRLERIAGPETAEHFDQAHEALPRIRIGDGIGDALQAGTSG